MVEESQQAYYESLLIVDQWLKWLNSLHYPSQKPWSSKESTHFSGGPRGGLYSVREREFSSWMFVVWEAISWIIIAHDLGHTIFVRSQEPSFLVQKQIKIKGMTMEMIHTTVDSYLRYAFICRDVHVAWKYILMVGASMIKFQRPSQGIRMAGLSPCCHPLSSIICM